MHGFQRKGRPVIDVCTVVHTHTTHAARAQQMHAYQHMSARTPYVRVYNVQQVAGCPVTLCMPCASVHRHGLVRCGAVPALRGHGRALTSGAERRPVVFNACQAKPFRCRSGSLAEATLKSAVAVPSWH